MRKSQSKRKLNINSSNGISLDSSLTSIEWLPKMQIGKSPLPTPPAAAAAAAALPPPPASLLPPPVISSLPISSTVKLQPHEIQLPTSNVYVKPPYSYVTLIRQAIMSATLQRMTLNEIYQWIVDSYPYFRTAPPKWKNSIRHNLSLNKCFKRLQRGMNDPGKGSYWAVDESNETNNSNARKRRFEDIQQSLHILPSSPSNINQQSTIFYTNNNPMICGDVSSVEGQSSSADESDSTMSLAANSGLIQWDDMNIDLTASFRRFREQILEVPSTSWINASDPLATTNSNPNPNPNSWNHELFPHGETNSFFESVKLASSGEINWHDVDVKPYCEFLDGFRTNSSFQQQDRDKLLNLASSLSSFFDYTGITNLAQNKLANESVSTNRYTHVSNRTISESTNNLTSLPVVIEDEAFDWDSIT